MGSARSPNDPKQPWRSGGVLGLPGTSEQITRLREEVMAAIATACSESDLLDAKGRFFGKKGAVSGILKGVAALPVEERKAVGELANRARAELESAFDARLAESREKERLLREVRERL